MTEDVFQKYGEYYDLLYQDKDYSAESTYVGAALRAHGLTAGHLLEFGSGTGRHGRLMANQGYEVFGIERSAAMVAAARGAAASSGAFDCALGDIRTVRLSRQFDGVLALFHVVSYQTGNADVTQTFANAARHLRPQGLFFFDVWHGPAVLKQRPSVRVKRVENGRLRLMRIAEPELDTNASVVTVRYTVLAESRANSQTTRFTEEHRLRYFFPAEIDLFAQGTGFAVESCAEFLTGAAPSEASWGVGYVLRKLT